MVWNKKKWRETKRIDVKQKEMTRNKRKWRETKEMTRNKKKWREAIAHDVSPVAMFSFVQILVLKSFDAITRRLRLYHTWLGVWRLLDYIRVSVHLGKIFSSMQEWLLFTFWDVGKGFAGTSGRLGKRAIFVLIFTILILFVMSTMLTMHCNGESRPLDVVQRGHYSYDKRWRAIKYWRQGIKNNRRR